MLPTVLSHELMEGVRAFLRATFPATTPAFRGAFDGILDGTGGDRLFQGPYLRVGLPFKAGRAGRDFFPRLKTEHPPYLHQEQAWERLRRENPKSTLVATGTGSGKTECFLYPILDHVLGCAGEPGIKAILLYPMNALANDQARRFARLVHDHQACRGAVRIGLYVGGQSDRSPGMTENRVITCRDEMRKSPPDILMTNYKMLDYLLIRQDDRNLWQQNAPETLRYLVVDEIHTFDGAQGTDLACLVRRVKARLRTPEGAICAVGTSATLGGPGAADSMRVFAREVFGEAFDAESVIQESRLSAREHIEETDNLEIRHFEPPGPGQRDALQTGHYDCAADFLAAQTELWFGEKIGIETPEERVRLAAELRAHNFLRTFLQCFEKRSGPDGNGESIRTEVAEEREILAQLTSRRPAWSEEHHRLVLSSFVSLCSHARSAPQENAAFLQIRSELWMRELSRMVASVDIRPQMRFSMDVAENHPQKHLPAVHCRECGAMGWGARMKEDRSGVLPELDPFYSAFFARDPDPRLCFVFPEAKAAEGDLAEGRELSHPHLCGGCLAIFESPNGICPECGTGPASPDTASSRHTIPAMVSQRTQQRENQRVADKSCPFCESSSGLTIVGSRAASLTSVALSQMFGSPFNDDKKAMAFSDSVQDASHRAGFFSARTYPIALRTALRQVLDTLGEPDLNTLARQFPAFWLDKLGVEGFTGLFIPPEIEWMDDFETFRNDQRLPSGSRLTGWVKDRLNWEAVREFGLQSRIGRTLEKSGAAASQPNPVAFQSAVVAILASVQELGGGLRGLDTEDVGQLVAALCERLRTNGGILHPFLDSYVFNDGNEYIFNQHSGEALPKIARKGRGRRPVFFASFREPDTFERLVNPSGVPSWAERWTRKWLERLLGGSTKDLDLTPILDTCADALVRSGLWQKREIRGERVRIVWGLAPDKLQISPNVCQHACDACGHQTSTSTAAAATWDGLPCLRHVCEGSYHPVSGAASFFGDLYRRGHILRLRAAEHTGMLDRPTRERIEASFMRQRPHPTDVNLLSCTPTMEMGVDVGGLSTVVLCSVPPERANYLQRVGRGGRRDGNSLALTVATSDPHDLAYYANPKDMLDGEVRMPAIYLRAPAVLERQLTAYCIDRWIESAPGARIPNKMESIYLQQSQEDAGADTTGGFPPRFYDFVDNDLGGLLGGFVGMFRDGQLDEESIAYLRTFIQGDQCNEGCLAYKIQNAITAAFQDLVSLRARRSALTRALNANNRQKPRDEALDATRDQLMAERRGINALIRAVNVKPTLNFLTDEGLIPNYAFPEEGVSLRSIILRKPETTEGDGRTRRMEFEHIRPAEAAITELAPGNSFYVEGRKLVIDRVAINHEETETWHFCASCTHVEPASAEAAARHECPRCGCQSWNDASLRQQMLRMRQVFVTAWDKFSRNLDDKDERDLVAFNKQTSVAYETTAIRRSFSLRAGGAAFAFDFISQITLREVNLGRERPDANVVRIGGRNHQGIGFQLCQSCGKVQSAAGRGRQRHDIACPHYGRTEGEETIESTVLLFRELKSEAVKLLIPSLDPDEGRDTQSFVAAIHLGLREVFGGHLHHLKLTVQKHPIPGSKLDEQHAFIYDSVPGGTGYLKDLTREPAAFMGVLEKARNVLASCPCANDPMRDGCYQCIKAYRFRFVHNRISRSTALRQIDLILANQEHLQERAPDAGVVNPLIESELERRFIEKLRQTDGARLSPEIVEGRPGYLLRMHGAAWRVIPQMEFGRSRGVSPPSRPDFLLQPLRPQKGRAIAVFLDGFAFHADASLDNNRIAADMAKRNALRQSAGLLVWSLTWADLHGENKANLFWLPPAKQQLAATLRQLAPEIHLLPVFKGMPWNGWDLLLDYLRHTATSSQERPAGQWMLAAFFIVANTPTRWHTHLEDLEENLKSILRGDAPEPAGPGAVDKPEHTVALVEKPPYRMLVAASCHALQNRTLDESLAVLWFDDDGRRAAAEFQREWQDLLRMSNLLQFIPRFLVATRLMARDGLFSHCLDWLLSAPGTAPDQTMGGILPAQDQLDELEGLDPMARGLLDPLIRIRAIPTPEFGYEWIGTDGSCSESMLEAAWPDRMLGIAVPGNKTADFENAGWTILHADAIMPGELQARFHPD